MRSIEMTGNSVDEAISDGLAELRLTVAEVKVEILNKGTKGNADAKVRLTEKVKTGMGEKAGSLLKELLDKMGVKGDVVAHEDSYDIRLEISNTPHGAILIGYRGKTLNSLQYLVNQIVNRNATPDEQRFTIEVDTQDYRNRRRKLLSKMVKDAISKIQSIDTPVDLEPMGAYDRKYIHLLLKDDAEFSSSSTGIGQDRHIIISRRSSEPQMEAEETIN